MAIALRRRAGYAEILACTALWGTIGPIVRWIDLPAATIAFYRLALAFAVVLSWLAVRRGLGDARPGPRRGLLLACGALLGAGWVIQFVAFKRLGVGLTILIVFVAPVLWVIAAPRVLGERLRPVALGALLAAFAGVVLISVPALGRVDRLGLAAALAGAVLFATYILAGKVLTAHYPPEAVVVWSYGVAAVLLSPAAVAVPPGEVLRAAPLLLVLGVLHTGALGIVFFRAVRALPAQELGVLYYLEPASAVLYAWWWLGETPSVATLAGGTLIVLAGMALIRSEREVVVPGA